ncbi:class I SAM-dependent methyltransferase [Actinomadura sp. GC306]|uniref:class I SAM-dependent methyltransferase n=1 Tax=Actinomadura sp. GC306 TaxID=2530367 RepID=UPI00104A1DD6|nr:class I SAM-dependent methyltransferase [Actinomadura sp. GC306]TDC68953.1 class I SAM-dependent methyltransferase [Actinomadura sp. GC306]
MKQAGSDLPGSERSDEQVQGHWLLARLGKKVLRPGGAELTRRMLDRAGIGGSEVVELAPGLGRTAQEIIERAPGGYVGVDSDAGAAARVQEILGERGTVRTADAAETGLASGSADVVIGEAMLTMQGDRAKAAIVAEAARILRPGGRYAIHELGLTPDGVGDEIKTEVRQALARSIRVNARPQTIEEWRALLEAHGFTVEHVETAPMALLKAGRLVADEGLGGALRFGKNVLTHSNARSRVLDMRRVFRKHRKSLIAVALVARKDG